MQLSISNLTSNQFYKVILCLALLSNLLQSSFAQESEARFASIIIPGSPSPNAASLGQYANNIVSNFTGLPSINVPIYEIEQSGFKLPISLSYNASGIKVGDIAGWVGMG